MFQDSEASAGGSQSTAASLNFEDEPSVFSDIVRFNLFTYTSRLGQKETLKEIIAKAGSAEESEFLLRNYKNLKNYEDLIEKGKIEALERKIVDGMTLNELLKEPNADRHFILAHQDHLKSYCKKLAEADFSAEDSTVVSFGKTVKGKTFGELLKNADQYSSWLSWLKYKSKITFGDDDKVNFAINYFAKNYKGWNDLKEWKNNSSQNFSQNLSQGSIRH